MIVKEKGITLVALIITIIILLILAGITVSFLSGEKGILNRATDAGKKYTIEAIKEEIELTITDIQAVEMAEGRSLTKEVLLEKLPIKLDGLVVINESIIVKYKDHYFKIFEDYHVEVVIDYESNNPAITDKKKGLILDGSTYINTGIQENEFLPDSSAYFTIAIQVKINKTQQSRINNMDILGNHREVGGFALQFNGTTTTLSVGGGDIDYTPYYDQWTDIVITYHNTNLKFYVNGELKTEVTNNALTPYGNLLLGSGFTLVDRAMIGQISSFKLWTQELTKEEVEKIVMLEEKTKIQSSSIMKELILDSISDVEKVGTLVGSNYEFIPRDKQLEYTMVLGGSTYISTKIAQKDFLPDGSASFTIGTRVKINREQQARINHMDILGNHYGAEGISIQFNAMTTDLDGIDYTPYYDQWTDIILTYSNGVYKYYINGELEIQITRNLTPYSNLLLGNAFIPMDRAMIGQMASFKLWKQELTKEEVSTINMMRNTEIARGNLIKEAKFNTVESITDLGTIVGGNCTIVRIKE